MDHARGSCSKHHYHQQRHKWTLCKIRSRMQLTEHKLSDLALIAGYTLLNHQGVANTKLSET